MKKFFAILAALILCIPALAQTNRNAHRPDQMGWASPDAVAAAMRIEAHARELGLSHSQIMTIHSINLRTQQVARPAAPRPLSKTRRIIVGTPMDPATQALQQIQRMLNMHQRQKVVQAGWLNGN